MAEDTSNKAGASDGKRRFSPPDTFLILFWVALLAWLATYIVPAGQFTDTENGVSLESFETVGRKPATLFGTGGETGFLNLFFDGLVSGGPYSATVGLMAFLLIIGGAFGIIMRTGAMEAGLKALLAERETPADWLPPLLFVLFSLGGAIFGMSEETIVFVMILLPAFQRVGYDSLTVIATVYVGTQVGFATSWMNPFSVVVAQGIADVPVLSGAGFRIIMWAVFTAVGAAWIWRYARAVQQAPEASPAHASDAALHAGNPISSETTTFTIGHVLIIAIVVLGIGWVAWGVGVHQYYFPELGAQFLTMGLAAALVGRVFRLNGMDFNAAAQAFQHGAMQLVPAALIVGIAKGVVILLGGDDPSEPSVLNTALASIASLTSNLPEPVAGVSMFLSQATINLFVVSGSGQAALTMPLMAPLADLSGLNRQSAVLAFQLGDGFTNIIVPASAPLMGCLAATKLSWTIWAAFVWRFLALLILLGMATMLVAVLTGFN